MAALLSGHRLSGFLDFFLTVLVVSVWTASPTANSAARFASAAALYASINNVATAG
jgi:hypothetical protein